MRVDIYYMNEHEKFFLKFPYIFSKTNLRLFSYILNQLRTFMDQFVHYIHGKVCSYPVFNTFAQYVSKILPIL